MMGELETLKNNTCSFVLNGDTYVLAARFEEKDIFTFLKRLQ